MWVPVTTAWRVLRLRLEERPPIWKVAANVLNKQSRTTDKGWSSKLGVGRVANNSCYGMFTKGSGWGQVSGACECGNELLGSIKCGEFLD